MASWLFSSGHQGSKRRLISFIMCDINGPWLPSAIQVGNQMHEVFKALGENTVNLTIPNGTKISLKFKNEGLISIHQSMLLFANEDLVEPEKINP